jgi:hypothetical protein
VTTSEFIWERGRRSRLSVAVPIFRISLANATVLSVAYLLMALVVDASRRWLPFYWTERASFTVEWIPSRTLEWFGLLEPMRQAVLDDQLSNFEARMILGLVSVAGIFVIALLVGIMMWLGRAALSRLGNKVTSG